MVRSSLSSLRNGIALSLAVLSLSACSQPRKPDPPQVIPCPPPLIDPELLIPPRTQGIDRLLSILGLPPMPLQTAGMPSSDSAPSKAK